MSGGTTTRYPASVDVFEKEKKKHPPLFSHWQDTDTKMLSQDEAKQFIVKVLSPSSIAKIKRLTKEGMGISVAARLVHPLRIL